MSKDCITVSGVVTHRHPAGRFTVKLEVNDLSIDAFPSGKIRQNNINIAIGDKVDIELSPYDLSKGRIAYRHK